MTRDERNLHTTELLVIILVTLLIIAYVFMIATAFKKLTDISIEELWGYTETSARNLSETLSDDYTQIDTVADEIGETFADSEKDQIATYLNSLLAGQRVCKAFYFIYPDGSFFTSVGNTGTCDAATVHLYSANENPELTYINGLSEQAVGSAFLCKPVKHGENVIGLLVGEYDYDKILNLVYPDTYENRESFNFILDSDGNIVMDTFSDAYLQPLDNFIEFAKSHSSQLLTSANGKNASQITEIVIDGTRYNVSYASVSGPSEISVARITPVSFLYAQRENIFLLIVIFSMLVFFVIIGLAYKYYKNTSASSEKIWKTAYTDSLTGFSNFAKFSEDAQEILNKNKKDIYYICCIDMIGFRYINDAFGYEEGDKILIEITKHINDLLVDDEIFARISGDKYVILTKRDFSDTDHNLFLYQLTDRISTISPLAKSHIRLEVQMGIYRILDGDAEHMSINELYDRSLIALQSIEHVDTGVMTYDALVHNEQIENKNIESKMRDALRNGEFRVYVQPKYRTNNEKLASGEALIRWIDPEKGIIPPIKFIPLFEKNRFVHDVDLYVMEVVSRFLRMRLNEGLPVVPISLNVSPVEMSMPNFRESYIAIKEKYEIPDKLIELEFTEGIFFENEQLFKDVIKDFQEHGFTCSLDDFGSGYSSLNILKELPVDTLKLDRLFFRESGDISRDRSVIRSVVAMARSLNIKTVAEGVETLDTVDFLKMIGCTMIQGYIYSMPLPLTEFEEKLNNESIDVSADLDIDRLEIVPLNMPINNMLSNSYRQSYNAIIEINTGGNIYHIFYPGGESSKFEKMPERGYYSIFTKEIIPKFVHPEDVDKVTNYLNPISLGNHFKTNAELDFEYRHMRIDGIYSWIKAHIIKASGGRAESQIYITYLNVIDNYKETEQHLEILQSRFSSAYSNFNGVVFELDMSNETIEFLETHSKLLSTLRDVKDFNIIKMFIADNLLHPDYKEKLFNICNIDYLRQHFIGEKNKTPVSIEVMAKPSRKSDSYNFYEAVMRAQSDPDKILITVEDITDKKIQTIEQDIQRRVTDIALASIYEDAVCVYLNRDFFRSTQYVNGDGRFPQIVEGKYSVNWQIMKDYIIKEEDAETLDQIFNLDGLKSYFRDKNNHEFKISFQKKASKTSDDYLWYEALIIALHNGYNQDEIVYIFSRCIEERKETEKNLNEYAHRLSYSLAMFEYAYSVNFKTEEMELIGGLGLDGSIFNKESVSYNQITLLVKNSMIAEEEQSAFRRFTYLDELLDYFSQNAPIITKYFKAADDPQKIVEVTAIYGARESKITIFARKLNKNIMNDNASNSTD